MVQSQAFQNFLAHHATQQGNTQKQVQFSWWHFAENALLEFEPQAWYRDEHGGFGTVQILNEGVQ